MDGERTLAQLAEDSGVPARTIRYYIARGLLPGPDKAGRGAFYTDAHLEGLNRIQELQKEGQTLSEIERMAGASQQGEATPWWKYSIDEDVEVWVRADAGPWRTKEIRAAIEEMTARLRRTRK